MIIVRANTEIILGYRFKECFYSDIMECTTKMNFHFGGALIR